ncbi:MAG: choice-of-anchor J domain-containing protein, partial [Dolichospermum sp.]
MIKKLLSIFLLLGVLTTNLNAQFVLDESFAGGTFPPTGWTRGASLDDSGNPVWVRSNASGYATGSGSAFCYFFNWTAGTDSLTSPVFTPTGASDTLYFDHAYRSYAGEPDNLKVFYSTDGGGTWTLLQDLPGGSTVGTGMVTAAPSTSNFLSPTTGQWASKKYLLPAGVNKIRFQVISGYGNNLFLDNIKVGKPAAIDASATNLLLPISPIFTSTTINNLRGVAQNNSATTQTISLQRTITPGGYTSTKTLNNIAAGATDTATFDPWTFVSGTIYTIKDSVILAGDASVVNDAVQGNFAPETIRDILIVNADAVSKDSLVIHLNAAGLSGRYNQSLSI